MPPPEARPAPPPPPWLTPVAFAVAVPAFLGAMFPFVGLLGLVAVVLAVRDRATPMRKLRGAAIVLGGAGVAAAVGWVAVFCEPPQEVVRASCPRVHGWDGARYRLETSMVASSLYPWAQRLDVDRAAHLRPDGGEYRLRVQNESGALDHVDSVELWIADHERDVEILPTTKGALVAVKGAEPPVRATDAAGADVLPMLLDEDGRAPAGAITAGSDGEPRWVWTLDFPRPMGARALLVLRGRGTEFAESAFAGYLAWMGQGMGPFMEIVEKDSDEACVCAEEVLDEELALLHLPLVVTVAPGTETAKTHAVAPVGPATVRSFVLPIELPPGATGDRVTVRIESTPRFWEIDKAALAPDPGAEVTPIALEPRSAELVSPTKREDVQSWITVSDRRRVAVRKGELVEVRFDAPDPAPGLERSIFIALRGYYQVPIGGRRLVNPAAILAHRWGLRSLPRFAASLP